MITQRTSLNNGCAWIKRFFSPKGDVFAHKVCDCSGKRQRFEVGIFICELASQGKIVTLNLIRTVSPTHTDVRVFMVFV